jgi:fructokinase
MEQPDLEPPILGGIDAGGTSFRCLVGHGPTDILAETSFPTTTPQETLAQAIAFFRDGPGRAATGIGIACFGPVAVDPAHPRHGHILATPKPGWADTDVVGPLAAALARPVRIETDVIAAALGEARWGAGQGEPNLAYITVGTGIGAGILAGGQPLHGALHPEAGHIRVPRHPDDLAFAGVCPFHGDCVEGLASAPALKARWGADPADLPDDHPAWEIEAHYLAHLCATLVLVGAVRRVILGGGVSARTGLVERVNARTGALLNGYAASLGVDEARLVVAPGLGLRAGVLGALAVATQAPARPPAPAAGRS